MVKDHALKVIPHIIFLLVSSPAFSEESSHKAPPANINTAAVLLDKCVKTHLFLNDYISDVAISPTENMLIKCVVEFETVVDACIGIGKQSPKSCRQNMKAPVQMEVERATDPYRDTGVVMPYYTY